MKSATILKTHLEVELFQNEQIKSEDKFNKTIIDAVDHSFSAFSNLDKQQIYFSLENNFKITKKEIPCKIEAFTNALEKMFGAGAKVIEIKIVEAIHDKVKGFKFFPTKNDISFEEYISSLRAFLLQNS